MGKDINDDDGFGLLREMENWDEDDVNTEEDWDGIQRDIHTKMPEFVGEHNISEEQYEADFPLLQKKGANKQNWGPIQAHRACTRHAGDTRTILQKLNSLRKLRI